MFGVLTSLQGHKVKLTKNLTLGSGITIPAGTKGQVLEEWVSDGRMLVTVDFGEYGYAFITFEDL